MGADDYRLIELIRQNRFLYDHSHHDFQNLEKKEITWRAIAAAQGSTPEICRRRFRGLRDRFAREKRQNGQQLLDGSATNPIWLKMMFLWDHLKTHRRFQWNRPKHRISRFQNTSSGISQIAIQNVYTVVPVDPSGAPMPNHPVTSASYVLVNASPGNSLEAVGRNSTVAEVQGPPEIAEQQAQESLEGPSDVEEQKLSEGAEQVSSKSVFGKQSDEDEVTPEVVAADAAEQMSPETVAKVTADAVEVMQLKDIEQENPEMVNEASLGRPNYSKRGLKLRGKKRLKPNNADRKPSKRTKTADVRSAKDPGLSLNPAGTVANSSCNAAFCTVVKNYLDKISNPMRLSSTRIKLLSLVHEEMFSTN